MTSKAEAELRLPRSLLDPQERAVLALRQLYLSRGYRRARMGKFEPYDLYARHKDFLVSDAVLTFTGQGGRLLALRPDVTLSLVKGYSGRDIQRLQYNETVYRPGPDGDHREIMQAGLECLGDIDLGLSCEVLGLAAASLQALGQDHVLTLSHSGLVQEALNAATDEPQLQAELRELLRLKSLGALQALRQGGRLNESAYGLLRLMIVTEGAPEEALSALAGQLPASPALAELRQVCEYLSAQGNGQQTRLDFSLYFDPHYYEGLVFKGYLAPLPEALLSGGRYDPLMRRMKKAAGGIGFAVYLEQLDRLNGEGQA